MFRTAVSNFKEERVPHPSYVGSDRASLLGINISGIQTDFSNADNFIDEVWINNLI